MVFLLTPVMRTVERIEHPSTRAETTATCLAVLSLFILTIMLDRVGNVNKHPPSTRNCSPDGLSLWFRYQQRVSVESR